MSAEPEQRPRDRAASHEVRLSAPVEPEGTGEAEQFWRAVQDLVHDRLGHARAGLWFGQTEVMSFDGRALVIGAPNIVIQQYLDRRYRQPVKEAAEELLGHEVEVGFDVAPRLYRRFRAQQEAELQEDGEAPLPEPSAAPARAERVPPDWGFDRLVMTRSNQFPFAAARELAGQENPRFRFVYVCGDYGVGKSALMRAMYALAAGPERALRPVLASAEDWCNEYYFAIQQRRTRPFRSRYRSSSMFLLDDIQFVEGKDAGQQELLHTVKHVLSEGGRVALAGKPRPEELHDIDPALRALLARAFPAVLIAAAGEEKEEAVRLLAARRGLKLADGAHACVAELCGEGFGAIESAVNCLAFYAAVHGCAPLETHMVREALAALRPSARGSTSLDAIKERLAGAFGVTAEEMTGGSRRRTVLVARQAAMYLARELTGASLTDIGRSFGGRSHSTVAHAVQKVEEMCAADEQFARLVQRLRSEAARG